MLKINQKKAQAVTELAVFGAILIYLLGTIIRSSIGNGITQNENFKAMRMAMLASWEGALQGNISHNSASVLVVEDRLSPDFNKYGALDRSPYIANGAGTFSYQLLYPLTPGQDDMQAQMPIMDVYINGQHFPFATALYVADKLLVSPDDGYPACAGIPEPPILAQQQCLSSGGSTLKCAQAAQAQCELNQCLRYRREWVGGDIGAGQFDNVIQPVTVYDTTCLQQPTTIDQKICQEEVNSRNIFSMLSETPNAIIYTPAPGQAGSGTTWRTDTTQYPSNWSYFVARYTAQVNTIYFPVPPYPKYSQNEITTQLANIKKALDSSPPYAYKLFYTMVANELIPGAAQATPVYSYANPPSCASHPCKDQELSADRVISDINGSMGNSGTQSEDLMFDMQRLNIPPGQANSTVVPATPAPYGVRPYMAWQWAATAGTTAGMIGLNTSNNQFPNYDIDGRLKEVTIYSISCCSANGEPTVSYQDNQLGDIDGGWDTNSCAPKPGLQSDAQVYTFTQNGTYLQIKEGQLLNPESGEVVRSQNKRDTIDLIQRSVQLSNNTRRFCQADQRCYVPCTDGSACGSGGAHQCANHAVCNVMNGVDCAVPNDVEVCIAPNSKDANGKVINCFSSEMNIKSTCFDENSYMLYVRSRLQDLRGHFWMTNTSGQLKVQQ